LARNPPRFEVGNNGTSHGSALHKLVLARAQPILAA
jgi:hypothetical protein